MVQSIIFQHSQIKYTFMDLVLNGVQYILCGRNAIVILVSIPACHAGYRGSMFVASPHNLKNSINDYPISINNIPIARIQNDSCLRAKLDERLS